MKLEFTLAKPATIITKASNPYDFNGQKGTSYTANLLIGDDVQKVKITEDVFNSVEVNKRYSLNFVAFPKNNDPKSFTLSVDGVSEIVPLGKSRT